MEIKASTKAVRVSPRKVRLVADTIRKMSAVEALTKLSFIKQRGASVLEDTLKSAIYNAVNNGNLKKELLVIKSLDVLESPSIKRFHPSTRGRVHPYKKRGSQIRIVLEEKQDEKGAAENGTKS